jgi:spore coat polysaccharide biosynthesis protein SpsF
MDKPLVRPARGRIVAIVQARMGSTRLPGKTLLEIAGKPFLLQLLERIAAARLVDQIVVATTKDPADQPIADAASGWGAGTFRGSENDVLDRFYKAATEAEAAIIIRITADDPFKDPDVNDLVVSRLIDNATLDYASNTIVPTYPEGLDVEVFTYEALARAWNEAKLPSEREHVTPYIWKHPEKFRIENVTHEPNLSHLRWTLDYEADLNFTRAVYERLYRGQIFRMKDVLDLLDREPALAEMNSGIVRNAGYAASVQREQQHI